MGGVRMALIRRNKNGWKKKVPKFLIIHAEMRDENIIPIITPVDDSSKLASAGNDNSLYIFKKVIFSL